MVLGIAITFTPSLLNLTPITQGVVTSDGNEVVDAHKIEVLEDSGSGRLLFPNIYLLNVPERDSRGTCDSLCGGMQKSSAGAACSVDDIFR